MAGPCIHGFAPGTCLICQTLDGPRVAEGPRAVAPEGAGEATKAVVPSRPRGRVKPRSGPRVVPKEAPRSGSPAVWKLLGVSVAVVLVIVVAWTVLHLVLAVLHIVELVGVALIAGYLGWVVGVHHGHRSAPRK